VRFAHVRASSLFVIYLLTPSGEFLGRYFLVNKGMKELSSLGELHSVGDCFDSFGAFFLVCRRCNHNPLRWAHGLWISFGRTYLFGSV